jgi:hypothetical protein
VIFLEGMKYTKTSHLGKEVCYPWFVFMFRITAFIKLKTSCFLRLHKLYLEWALVMKKFNQNVNTIRHCWGYSWQRKKKELYSHQLLIYVMCNTRVCTRMHTPSFHSSTIKFLSRQLLLTYNFLIQADLCKAQTFFFNRSYDHEL